MNFIVAGLVALCLVAVVFIVRLRGRGRHDSKNEAVDPANPNKIDTTLGEFHDMRQALRPLHCTNYGILCGMSPFQPGQGHPMERAL